MKNSKIGKASIRNKIGISQEIYEGVLIDQVELKEDDLNALIELGINL